VLSTLRRTAVDKFQPTFRTKKAVACLLFVSGKTDSRDRAARGASAVGPFDPRGCHARRVNTSLKYSLASAMIVMPKFYFRRNVTSSVR